MPAINVSLHLLGTEVIPDDQGNPTILHYEVSPELKLVDLKEYVSAEADVAVPMQQFWLNGRPLLDDTQTLERAGIKDNDMVTVLIGALSARDAQIESRRKTILGNEQARNQVLMEEPQLGQVLDDPVKFREAWISLEKADREEAARRRAELQQMDSEVNEENQAKILEIIRQARIEADIEEVVRDNPELYGRVTMLYINLEVNGHPVKAFVDSGAQATIMSPDCAEACSVTHLIDKRYYGLAVGVGTARILGRVHRAPVKIGDYELPCAFTVMEGKDVDMLLGLDMLKRYQACIDLHQNCLILQGSVSVPFLPESEIPRKHEEAMENEPTVPGPAGTAIGAVSGALKPAAGATSSPDNFGGPGHVLGESSSQSTQTPVRQAPPASPQPPPGPPQPQQIPPRPTAPTPGRAAPSFPQSSIDQLVSLGYSREQAVEALRATGGNVEYAAGFLFDDM